jgi:hypothetical protein
VSSLDEYFGALERLKAGQPLRVARGTRITNDAVALEAGRGKGSIKKSRPVFRALLDAIEQAAAGQTTPARAARHKLEKAKDSANGYREQLEAALAREVSLLRELYAVKKELARVTGRNVLPIRGGRPCEGEMDR